MFRRIVPLESEEFSILSLMTKDTHKFAIAVNYPLEEQQQLALERLMLKDWIRLIDVAPTAVSDGHVMRVFRVMPEAVAWYEAQP